LQDAQAQQKARFNAPDSCSGTIMQWTDPFTCLWRSLLSALGAGLVWLVSWLVTAAGMFFNWSIKVTVINFTGLFYTPAVNEAVGQVWTNLRDLANIFIIGLFVFIAISIILGLQEFGQKKLIARVVVVAILINFSFLFTQIAINASNFFATQIIAGKAQELPVSGTSAAVGVANNTYAASGVAGEFLKFAGAETFGDTFTALHNVADKNQSAWVALLHGLMAAILLTLAAATLFYGGMLLLSRGLIFLFLIMTSAFAFATYLSPALAESDYGFKGWKNQLMRNVMLAPAMMIFLWATLKIAKALSSTGTLGSLISSPTGEAGIGALFSYLLIIGLLFGSLKLSSSLAGASGRLALGGAALGLNIPGKALAAAGRWYIGGRAAVNSHATEARFKSKSNEIATLDPVNDKAKIGQLRGEMLALSRQKGRSDFLAKSSFDMANLKSVQKLNAAAGLGGVFGKTDKSYDKTSHAQDDKAIKEAIKAAVDNSGAEKLARGENKDAIAAAERTHEDNRKILEATEKNAETLKSSEKLLTRMEEHRGAIADATAKQAESSKKFNAGSITKAEHDANMAAQKARIDDARNNIGSITSRIREIEAPVGDLRRAHRESGAAINALDKRIKERAREIQKNSSENAATYGASQAGGAFTRFIRTSTGVDLDEHQSHHVAEAIRNKTRGDRMTRAKQKKEEKEDAPSDDHAAHAPAAGAAHPPAH
jgi:hypothetical protein